LERLPHENVKKDNSNGKKGNERIVFSVLCLKNTAYKAGQKMQYLESLEQNTMIAERTQTSQP